MGVVEILLIIFCVISCSAILGVYIYKRIKHIPTGDCGCCHSNAQKIKKKYYKKYHSSCCCGKDENHCCCNHEQDKERE